jgi:hypothetical protein
MTTTGYQVAPETNDVQLSYGIEATWGTAPATTFKAVRLTSESLSGKKTRQRPPEVRTDGQVAAAVTTQETAGGQLNFAFSYGTYDDLIAALLNGTWSADLAIAGAGGDISAVAAGNKITSTTVGKFTNVSIGQWVKIAGFATAGNNGFAKVTAKGTAPDSITLAGGMTLANETPAGTAVSIKGSMIRNGTAFETLFLQKFLAASQYLTYPGSMISAGSLTSDQGKFCEGNFTFICKQESKATTDSSTGGVTAAPTGRVIDTVAGFQMLELDGAAITAVCKAVDLTLTRQGAAGNYGIGSAAAQGVIRGQLELAGKATFYFKDFTLYDLYRAETQHGISYSLVDNVGSTYMITIPAATIMNPQIVAGGPNQSVMAAFDLEGNPDPVTGCTIQIDRFQ